MWVKKLADTVKTTWAGMGRRQLLKIGLCDGVGSLLLGISVTVFAVQANFATGGVSGLGILGNYLFHIPIGMVIICINIPIILLTFRSLGIGFFLCSVRSLVISSLFIDYVTCWLPVFTGSRLAASVMAGICAGVGYALFFYEGSSTGGTDFIMVAIRRWKPQITLGTLAFVIDSGVIVLAAFVFQDTGSFLYGMVYTVVTSVFLDLGTALLQRFAPQTEERNAPDPAA